MRIIGILMTIFGFLLLGGGGAVAVTLALKGDPMICESVEKAKILADKASDDLARGMGTPQQYARQQTLDKANEYYRYALKNCDEARSWKTIQLVISSIAAVVGGLLFLSGIALFFVGRKRAGANVV